MYYRNINSLRYKVVDLRTLLSKFLPYYFVLAETKLDESFPNSQFVIDQYEIRTRRDRNKDGGGLIEYVRKGLICKALKDIVNLNSEIILSEITIKNNKGSIFSAYRPPCNSNIETCLGDLSNLLFLIESFVYSSFNYCLLVWHFCNQKSSQKIENLQKRALQFFQNDYTSSYDDLLEN